MQTNINYSLKHYSIAISRRRQLEWKPRLKVLSRSPLLPRIGSPGSGGRTRRLLLWVSGRRVRGCKNRRLVAAVEMLSMLYLWSILKGRIWARASTQRPITWLANFNLKNPTARILKAKKLKKNKTSQLKKCQIQNKMNSKAMTSTKLRTLTGNQKKNTSKTSWLTSASAN